MTIKIAINGFGRIGRSIFRIIHENPNMEVVAINDIHPSKTLAYLLKYDSIMGRMQATIEHSESALCVNGKNIPIPHKHNISELPWKELNVDFVVESTGIFRDPQTLEKHIQAGAKKVLLTVPPKGEIDAMVVMGVNDHILKPSDKIISNASCTTNCLAPLIYVLDNAFGLEKGMMTTVHAYTNDQRLADVPHQDFRRSRAAGENIIPTTTGAAKAVGKVLPNTKGKLDGIAVRVPVADGSLVDMTLKLTKQPSAQEINATVKEASETNLKNILEYATEPLVSSDIIGNPHSSIFDSLSTYANEKGYCRVLSWYDNEWGYSNRCVNLLEKLPS